MWVINGQKVWTSGGHLADLGMLLARTNPAAPKHQGITWFAIDMHQPGVEIRPLRQMTGTRVQRGVLHRCRGARRRPHRRRQRRLAVANTTLFLRALGHGRRRRSVPRPGGFGQGGTVAGDLGRAAGDFVRPRRAAARHGGSEAHGLTGQALHRAGPRRWASNGDPVIRQRLAQAHILGEIRRMNTERHKAVRAAGGDIPGIANFSKLLMGHILRHNRDLGHAAPRAPGGCCTATTPSSARRCEAAGRGRPPTRVTAQALQAQALPIFGGTDQIQRNIIGERVLGLPKEPGDLSRVPFNELPRNG